MLVNREIGIIAETIWFSYISYFSVIPRGESLNLIHTCIECMEYLYLYIQNLVVEPRYYVLTVFISDIFCQDIMLCPTYITIPYMEIWHAGIVIIILYMVSTHIHLYLSFLIWRIWRRDLTHILIRLVHHYHPVLVLIHDQVISSAYVRHWYWDIY